MTILREYVSPRTDILPEDGFRILSLKTKDTSASSWFFDFVSYFLARYKNENNFRLFLELCEDDSTVYYNSFKQKTMYV